MSATLDAAPVRTPLLHRPHASSYLLLGSTGLLLFIGLVMVFSASSVRAYATFGSSSAIAVDQAIYVALGLPIAIAASRMPVSFWRRAATPSLWAVTGLLVLVLIPGVGKEVDGTQGWLVLPGGLTLQPAEGAKLALVLWGADLLVRKGRLLREWRHLLVPLVPVATMLATLIMLQPDMGTTVALLVAVVALLLVCGAPLRLLGGLLAAFVVVFGTLAVVAPYRMARLVSFLDPFADAENGGFQAVQSMYAISSGGLFGQGLGAGASKWSGGLPNAYTDFIFAIICEETGLVGALAVLALFAAFAYAGVRIALRTRDQFVRYAAAAVTAVLLGQAIINLGGVVGLLPITGIPLPLVSYGGSSMLTTLLAVGMLVSFARTEPGRRPGRPRRRGTPERVEPVEPIVARRTTARLSSATVGREAPRTGPHRRRTARR